jgi:hypothetical protein
MQCQPSCKRCIPTTTKAKSMDEIVQVDRVRDERGRILPGARIAAGTRRGSLNRLTKLIKQEIARAIEAGELAHPLMALLRIANDPDVAVNLRIKANAEALPFLMPVKHALEIDAPEPADEAEIQAVKRRLQVLFVEEITNAVPGQ